MVLYHAVTTYQLLNCIVHRFIFHKNENAILVIPDFASFGQDEKSLDLLAKKGVFKEIFKFPYKSLSHNSMNLVEDVEKLYEETINYSLNELGNIYVGGVHYYFSIYLIHNNRKFYAFEEANGAYSRPEILRDALDNAVPLHRENAEKFKLVDYSNHLIEKVICDARTQVDGFYSEKLLDFNVVESMKALSSEELESLFDCFSVNREVSIKPNAFLLLTQHFMNLKILSFEEHAEIYQTFVDFFINNRNLYIKPHPEDVMYYDRILPRSTVLNGKFPTEFLPFIFDQKIESAATIYSTSINTISDCFKQVIVLSPEFRTSYKQAAKYYVALKLIKNLNIKDLDTVYTVGVDNDHLFTMAKYSDLAIENISVKSLSVIETIKNKIIIVDDISKSESFNQQLVIDLIESTDQNNILIFLNSHEDYCFYDYYHKNIMEKMHPLVYYRKPFADEMFVKPEEQSIYFYSKNEEYMTMATELQFEKKLENLQVNLTIEKMSPEQVKIKVLEGILKATEQRLLYYIEKERNDKQELVNNELD